MAANKVYEVQEDSLVPLPDSWGQMPKIEILSSDKVSIFFMCWIYGLCLIFIDISITLGNIWYKK